MQKARKVSYAIAASTLLLLAIWRTDTVVHGAKDGLSLCIQTVIPSIFPFLFLTMLVSNYLRGLNIPLFKPLCKATGIPLEEQTVFLLAMIGGYPVGAQAVAQAYKDRAISSETAHRLLGFCNNAGPSFIFGLLSTLFKNRCAVILLWLIHIGSALIVGWLLPNKKEELPTSREHKRDSISQILKNSLQVTAIISGWVIIFRVIISFLKVTLSKQDPLLTTVICGLLELSNGCVSLSQIPQESIRFVAATAMLSAGGLCVLMQTKSVTGRLGLGMYLKGKLMQILIGLMLSFLVCPLLFHTRFTPLPFLVCCILLAVMIKIQKSSSNMYINVV